jgi:arylsulfatase A-like enzyme
VPGSWPARLARFAAPTAAVAMAAASLAGLVEGALQGAPAGAVVCAAGIAALYAAPLAFAIALAARGLWHAWRPVAAPRSEGDGALFAGGAVYAALAVTALGAAGYGAALFGVVGRGPDARVSAPAVVAALAAAAGALLAASRPAVLGLAGVARALGLRRPRACLIAVAAMAGILALAIWFGVVGPALARIDYGFAGYGWTAVAALLIGHALARRLGRRARRAAGAAAALGCAALVAGALATRARDPAALFDAWFRMPVGGLAIGLTYDIDDLRAEAMPVDPTPRARPGAPHPDVVVLTIDTLRADQTRLYGGPAGMPNLEMAASRGVVFEWAFSPSNNTRQSVSAIMTGVNPARLRGRVVEFGLRLDPRHVVLAERFRAAGYATAGFLCCVNHMGGRKKIGLDRGLESVAYERDGSRLKDLATAWLRSSAGERRPRYLWVHFFDPHDWQWQFPAPGGGDGDAEGRYRQAIQRADRFLAPIVAAMEASGRPAILVIASDHGEGLGDHRAPHHSSNLYNSQIHVPLVIAGPGLGPARREAAPVALLDLSATLLDLAGFEPPGMPEMDARSFAGLVRGERSAGSGDVYAVMVHDRSVARTGRALVAGRHKIIAVDGRKPELYDIVADPAEARNLASRKPRVLRDMTARLRRRQDADAVAPF